MHNEQTRQNITWQSGTKMRIKTKREKYFLLVFLCKKNSKKIKELIPKKFLLSSITFIINVFALFLFFIFLRCGEKSDKWKQLVKLKEKS